MNTWPWNWSWNCRGNSPHSWTGSAPSLWWWAGGHQNRVRLPGRYSCLIWPAVLPLATYNDFCPLNVTTVLLWPERPLLKYIFLRTCHLNSILPFLFVIHRKICYIPCAICWGLPTVANPLTSTCKYSYPTTWPNHCNNCPTIGPEQQDTTTTDNRQVTAATCTACYTRDP